MMHRARYEPLRHVEAGRFARLLRAPSKLRMRASQAVAKALFEGLLAPVDGT